MAIFDVEHWKFNKLHSSRIYLLQLMMKPKISACIITNDNEKVFKAIKSVQSSCFEIIVGYNGNNAKFRKRLSEQKKVKLHDYKWRNNFSHARNFTIEMATGDWILIIDSDEVLTKKITKLNPEIDCYFAIIRNGEQDSWNPRLYKHNVGIKYVNKIHETIEPDIINRQWRKANLIIKHSGIVKISQEDLKKKFDRNMKILKRDPSNTYRNYLFATMYAGTGKHKKAIQFASLALLDGINPESKATLYNLLYQSYSKLGYCREGVFWLKKSLEILPLQVAARYSIVNYLFTYAKNKEIILQELYKIAAICQHKNSDLPNDLYMNQNIIKRKIKEIQKWQ